MMLKELPLDDPLFTYPPNIQKAIFLIAGIVARIHASELDMKQNECLIKTPSEQMTNEDKHDEK